MTELRAELLRIEAAGTPPRPVVAGRDLEEAKEAGLLAFGRWFSWFMDVNRFSHPQLVALCKLCTGGKAMLHSSTIAGYRNCRIKNPGPTAFVAIEYVCRDIDAAQRGSPITNFGKLNSLIMDKKIMRDENYNPVTAGYLTEVFLGLRPLPIDLSTSYFSDSEATAISNKTARLVRKLMVVQDLDPIEDAAVIGGHFPGNPQQKEVFAELIKGNTSWNSEEIEEQIAKTARLLEEQFQYKRSTTELLNELKG